MKDLIKEYIRKALHALPAFRRTRSHAFDTLAPGKLEQTVRRAIADVPFYASYAPLINDGFDLSRLPIIRKADIMGREKELVSRKAIRRFLSREETGGSTGHSLSLYYSPHVILRKEAFRDAAFRLIGKNLRTATLRGQRPRDGKIYEESAGGNIVLSSYLLSADTLDLYLKIINSHGIDCLHVYPSSLTILLRLIRNRGLKNPLPTLKGVLSSSEIMSPEVKALLRETLPGVKLVDLYSHNELAAFAVSEDSGPYRFLENFGHVEFIPTKEKTPEGLAIAEIVVTSVLNDTMPLLRYATDDYVALDSRGIPVQIIGRTSDFIVNKKGELTPCIVYTRPLSMTNVTNFQYYQATEGHLTFRVVTTPAFGDNDRKMLLEDLNTSFNGLMDVEVQPVPSIPRTKAGKQLRLLQEVDLSKYK